MIKFACQYAHLFELGGCVVSPYCFHAQGFSNPLNVSREVAALTTENLTPTDVSAATFIVEQLTQEAVRNSQVKLNCMLHVSVIRYSNNAIQRTYTFYIGDTELPADC